MPHPVKTTDAPSPKEVPAEPYSPRSGDTGTTACQGRRYYWYPWLIGHQGYRPCADCRAPLAVTPDGPARCARGESVATAAAVEETALPTAEDLLRQLGQLLSAEPSGDDHQDAVNDGLLDVVEQIEQNRHAVAAAIRTAFGP